MLKSHELLGFMSSALAHEILEFTFADDKPTYKAMVKAVADARHIRAVFLERQPRATRHDTMLSVLSKPALDLAAGTMIRTWLVKKQNAMLVDFLDALGIQHKDGVVENLPEAVADEKLKAAVESLLAKYPHETVAVYLTAFHDLNEAGWANLKALLETDSRLQLGG
ncbi:MAG: hypothetical protein EPO07_04125 [Verrucomicrobia bacterium]|nr:MAG: hypothetical protein EPO07_04125 [Verrucomicrobiota bacterium]